MVLSLCQAQAGTQAVQPKRAGSGAELIEKVKGKPITHSALTRHMSPAAVKRAPGKKYVVSDEHFGKVTRIVEAAKSAAVGPRYPAQLLKT